MFNEHETSEPLYKEWDRRWSGDNDREKVTILGRLMFRAKVRCLKEVISELNGNSIIDVGLRARVHTGSTM